MKHLLKDLCWNKYYYQDLTSKSIEYIAIEELSACEWFVKGKPVQVELMAEIQKNKNPLKPTKSNKNPKTDQNQTSLKVVNTSNAIAVKRKSHSFVEEYGPPKSIFHAVPLDKGSKRSRKIAIQYVCSYNI